MISERMKTSLINVAGEMAIAICENGSLPITIDELMRNFEQAYSRLQAITTDQEFHEPKARHVETQG